MLRTCAIVALAANLVCAAPLSAQIGLASLPQTVQLTAIKHGWVSVTPVPVTTTWNLNPEQTAAVTLVAYFGTPARAGAVGRRTDDGWTRIDLTTMPGLPPGNDTGMLTLVAVTQ
jgi:hypothetical protein